MKNHARGIRADSLPALMLAAPLLLGSAVQARADQCTDPGDVDVKITVKSSCGISVAPVNDADKCGFVSGCVKIRKDKWLRWKALDGDDDPVNFKLVFSPFESNPKESKKGCSRHKIRTDTPVAEYKYTVVITDGPCAGTIKDPRIKVED
ncbi:MAG: hypothetical protein PVG91_01635 [Gammaproteobacteria bacterium]|jgi:hypothetical protein